LAWLRVLAERPGFPPLDAGGGGAGGGRRGAGSPVYRRGRGGRVAGAVGRAVLATAVRGPGRYGTTRIEDRRSRIDPRGPRSSIPQGRRRGGRARGGPGGPGTGQAAG